MVRRWLWIGIVIGACGDDSAPASDDTTGPGSSSAADGESSSTPPPAESSSGGVVDTSGGSTGSSSSGSPTDDDGSTGSPPADPGCPECTVLADGLDDGRGVAVDGTHVYFSDQGAGTVERVALDGSGRTTIASEQDGPYDVALSTDLVYWTNHTSDGSVVRAPKEGGAAESVDDEADWARGVAVDDTHVYWTRFAAVEGALHRRPIGLDGPPELLYVASKGFAELALSDSRVFVTSHKPSTGGGAGFIEPPDEFGVGTVFSIPLEGDLDDVETVPVGGDIALPWGIAIEDAHVYFVTGDGEDDYAPNRIWDLTIGAPPPIQMTGEQSAPWGIAADDDWVYFTDASEVKAVPADGGDVVVLATMQNNARSIAVNDSTVVWITADRVLARAKP